MEGLPALGREKRRRPPEMMLRQHVIRQMDRLQMDDVSSSGPTVSARSSERSESSNAHAEHEHCSDHRAVASKGLVAPRGRPGTQ